MATIPIFIIVNDPNGSTQHINLTASSLDNSLKVIVEHLKFKINQNHKKDYLDYPADINIFCDNHWFINNESNDSNSFFNYNIFHNNEWTKPWTLQEIYEKVIKLIKNDDEKQSAIIINKECIIPIIIILHKPNGETEIKNLKGNSLTNALSTIVINLKPFIEMDIDYPCEIQNFTNCFWFKNNNYYDDFFDYYIFHVNEWITPWSTQEIYDDILELIHKLDIQYAIINRADNIINNNYDDDEVNEKDNETITI